MEHVALIELNHTSRACAYCLNYERDSATLNVAVSDGEWNALTFLVKTYDHKVTSLATSRDEWCLYFETSHLLAEHFFAYNLVHFQ